MTSIKRTSFQKEIAKVFRDDAKKSLAPGGQITDPLAKEAAAQIAQQKGPAAVTVDAMVDYEMKRTMDLIGEVNEPKGKAGYNIISKDELQRAEKLDPAAAGALSKAAAAFQKAPAGATGAQIKSKLDVLTGKGTMNFGSLQGSESDVVLSPVLFKGTNLKCSTPAELVKSLGVPVRDVAKDLSFTDPTKADGDNPCFYDRLIEAGGETNMGDQTRQLVQYVKDNLKDVHVAVFGQDSDSYGPNDPVNKFFYPDGQGNAEHRLLLIGRAKDGSLVALQGDLTWT